MKKTFIVRAACLLAAAALLSAGCASTTTVSRVDAAEKIDLSGYWNDVDVRHIADTLVAECVNAVAITDFIRNSRAVPTVIVGTFRNQSDEHIDTSILAKKFENALINSGRVDFVASAAERAEIRQERQEQQSFASEETAKRLGNETGADFMLIGSVKTIVDSADGTTVRCYIVNAELIDIETNKKCWVGENSDIKKVIQRSGTRR
ncbi:MAG: penicillin-binding protein activator LpoB [Bacteroides sp.]|nr:penicillin-binding protein activator LpoB [Prevotella sp.]MCM1408596.1 penicillin-binding protein activator LpoB [Treponema brennaborense]MCM1468916.1 penicillin-binding protein activator LpoB [Bacteroides sp.]